jgi:hypothetical protein
MKKFATTMLMALIGVMMLIPELPALAHPHYPTYGSRRNTKSSWTRHRRPRRAPREKRPFLYIGGGVLADFIGRGDADESKIIRTGGGFDLFLGFRLNPMFALEIGGLLSVHGTEEDLVEYDTAVLNGITLDGKFFLFPSSTRFEPFLQFGGGGYTVQEERYQGRELSGGGLHAGGGVDLHVTRALGFGVRALYKGIWMDNETQYHLKTKSVFHNHMTLEANVQLHF